MVGDTPSCCCCSVSSLPLPAPDAVVWSLVSLPMKRRIVQAVRDFAMRPGPEHIRGSLWVRGSSGGCQ